MADRSTPLRSADAVNCVETWGVETGAVILAVSACVFSFGAGLRVLRFHGDGRGAAPCTWVTPPAAGLRSLGSGLRALGQRSAERGDVNRSIGLRNDGADFGQAGVIEHEGLVLGGYAIEDAVRFGAGEKTALSIDGEAGDVGLAGIVLDFADASGGDAKDAALIAGADIERAIRGDGQRPDVARFGREVLSGFAVFDAIDLAIGRACRRRRTPLRIGGEGEDLGLIGGPQEENWRQRDRRDRRGRGGRWRRRPTPSEALGHAPDRRTGRRRIGYPLSARG